MINQRPEDDSKFNTHKNAWKIPAAEISLIQSWHYRIRAGSEALG